MGKQKDVVGRQLRSRWCASAGLDNHLNRLLWLPRERKCSAPADHTVCVRSVSACCDSIQMKDVVFQDSESSALTRAHRHEREVVLRSCSHIQKKIFTLCLRPVGPRIHHKTASHRRSNDHICLICPWKRCNMSSDTNLVKFVLGTNDLPKATPNRTWNKRRISVGSKRGSVQLHVVCARNLCSGPVRARGDSLRKRRVKVFGFIRTWHVQDRHWAVRSRRTTSTSRARGRHTH